MRYMSWRQGISLTNMCVPSDLVILKGTEGLAKWGIIPKHQKGPRGNATNIGENILLRLTGKVYSKYLDKRRREMTEPKLEISSEVPSSLQHNTPNFHSPTNMRNLGSKRRYLRLFHWRQKSIYHGPSRKASESLVLKEYRFGNRLLLDIMSLYFCSGACVRAKSIKSAPFAVGLDCDKASLLLLVLTVYMDWLNIHSCVDEGVTFEKCRINFVLFVDDFVLHASSGRFISNEPGLFSECDHTKWKLAQKKWSIMSFQKRKWVCAPSKRQYNAAGRVV